MNNYEKIKDVFENLKKTENINIFLYKPDKLKYPAIIITPLYSRFVTGSDEILFSISTYQIDFYYFNKDHKTKFIKHLVKNNIKPLFFSEFLEGDTYRILIETEMINEE